MTSPMAAPTAPWSDATENDRIDRLRRDIAATGRALSHNAALDLQFLVQDAPPQHHTLRLQKPKWPLQHPQVDRIRGAVDAVALHLLHHDAAIHDRYRLQASDAQQLFDILEQTRCEALGARYMLGVQGNLGSALAFSLQQQGIDTTACDKVPLPVVMQLLASEDLYHCRPSSAAAVIDHWRPKIESKIGGLLAQLQQSVADQAKFAQLSLSVLEGLGFVMPPPVSDDLGAASDDAQPDADESRSGDNNDALDQCLDEVLEAVDGSAEEAADTLAVTVPDSFDSSAKKVPGEVAPQPFVAPRNEPETSPPQYKIYTTEFDRVAPANELCEAAELARLRGCLDQQLAAFSGVTSKLANRMQRQLLTRQLRAWEFDLEEGYLDTSRLARVIANPTHALSYKMEQETSFRDTVVALLIDNSGSMRGRPISIAAITADILVRTLERCGVKTEILGFTTCAWKGGKTRERWLLEGKPANAGRLNDLLHIIYKSADMPWRRVRNNLGLMQREGMLKENIDGEALLWAHERLLRRPEQRRILMVISDGAPVDDSTLSTNPSSYLDRHLREVISTIQNQRCVELLAIGIGHDVTRYYKRAVTLVNAEELGGAVIEQLVTLFDNDWEQRNRRRQRHLPATPLSQRA